MKVGANEVLSVVIIKLNEFNTYFDYIKLGTEVAKQRYVDFSIQLLSNVDGILSSLHATYDKIKVKSTQPADINVLTDSMLY